MKLCARGDGDPDGPKFKCLPIEHRHMKRDYDSIDKEFEISCRCLDKKSEDGQNYPCTENMGKTM